MKTAVVYKSKYGFTKRYAEWIAEALGCPLYELSQARAEELGGCEAVVYGGGVYAGSIAGLKALKKIYAGRLVVFAVGISNGEEKADVPAAAQDRLAGAAFYKLPGGYEFKRLTLPHRLVMAAVRRAMSGREGVTAEEKAALYGDVYDRTDRAAAQPLIDYVRGLGEAAR